AEDGIRAFHVTGVQTCALPIYLESVALHPDGHSIAATVRGGSYTMALWEGAVRRHGSVSSVRRRLTQWTAEGDGVVAVTDETGRSEERRVGKEGGCRRGGEGEG